MMILTLLALPLSFFRFFNIFFQFTYVGLVVQFCKCTISSPFRLLTSFSPPTKFYYLLDGIRVLGILFDFTSFNFSFLRDKLDKDVCHMDAFSRLGDV